MVKNIKVIILGFFGVAAMSSLLFSSLMTSDSKKPGRIPNSEDFESREFMDPDEETDYYDNYQMLRDNSEPNKKSENPRALDKKEKNKKKSNRRESQDPIGDDVEWSKNTKDSNLNKNMAACQAGQSQACWNLGKSLFETNSSQGLFFIAKACNLRNFDACEEAGHHLKQLRGPAAAYAYFKAACDANSLPESCFEAADYLETHQLANSERINAYYRLACNEGNEISCQRVASHTVASN